MPAPPVGAAPAVGPPPPKARTIAARSELLGQKMKNLAGIGAAARGGLAPRAHGCSRPTGPQYAAGRSRGWGGGDWATVVVSARNSPPVLTGACVLVFVERACDPHDAMRHEACGRHHSFFFRDKGRMQQPYVDQNGNSKSEQGAYPLTVPMSRCRLVWVVAGPGWPGALVVCAFVPCRYLPTGKPQIDCSAMLFFIILF